MTYTEILELIRAGYTRDEIEAMQKREAEKAAQTSAEPVQTSTEPEQTIEQDKPTPEQNRPESEPEKATSIAVSSEVEKLVAALGMKLDALTGALPRKNIGAVESNGPQTETPEDILARIINPNM